MPMIDLLKWLLLVFVQLISIRNSFMPITIFSSKPIRISFLIFIRRGSMPVSTISSQTLEKAEDSEKEDEWLL